MTAEKTYSIRHFNIKDEYNQTQKQLLLTIMQWANSSFDIACVLNSNSKPPYFQKGENRENDFDAIIAVGSNKELICSSGDNFKQLKEFYSSYSSLTKENNGAAPWMFGFLNYDLKNEIEELSSSNQDGIKMPLMHFFVPQHIFIFKTNNLEILSSDTNFDLKEIIQSASTFKQEPEPKTEIILSPRISRDNYINTVNKIKQHIYRGDIYEMNFCQEFFANKADIDPVQVYNTLNEISPMPFSCFYKLRNKYLICSSPERFLKKTGNKIISQPIKGTIRKGKNVEEDRMLKKKLREDRKEQSENVMIVDLVRNDLSRFAKKGTVHVDELFGIYTFPHLHQMISTISCELDDQNMEDSGDNSGCPVIDAIKFCFPMGSMTGAPKVKAMELIEKYESTKRGLFSGSAGYFSPNGDFDFNVVIRSIIYDRESKFISAMAGSAITAGSIAEKEYEECLLKAEPMFKALKNT